MSQTTTASENSECLLRIIEAAPQVCRRYQFFVWSQGDLQRWLPHKIVVCGAYDRDHRDVVFDIFNSVPLPDALAMALKDPRSSLISAAIQAWRKGRQQPFRLTLAQLDSHDGLCATLLAEGYDELLIHGLSRPGRPEELESFFVFAQPGHHYTDDTIQALGMLLSCVHLTYQRVCVTERQMSSPRLASTTQITSIYQRQAAITLREREILVWVRDGLSNQQISEKLGISALTVKNHVQKILRKLGAANRAQAVAKAMTMNALGATQVGSGDSYI
jgi:transcriptional regulator EpsA